jgi:hypothetical protein
MKKILRHLTMAWELGTIVFAATLAVVACNFPQINTTPPPPTTLACDIPVFNALPETKLMQTKGGLEITVSPAHYASQIQIIRSAREIAPPLLSLRLQGATKYIEVTQRPEISINPNRIKFGILINNLLPRVFRGAGSVVQISAGGKAIPVSANDYAELTNVTLPPRQQQEVLIYGPPLSQLGTGKTTIGVFIYDIVTKVDAAGNILEKQNFEWFFDYSTQHREESAPPVKITSGWAK